MSSHILADGRRLSFEDAGPRGGKPVLYFHGVPSAGTEWHMWGDEALLNAAGVRLIAMDRPGVGGSTFQPNRRLSDWPTHVVALANALGLERFSVLGYSGGGPYAAVCAALIPDRLLAVGMVSSLTSFDRSELLEGLNPQNLRFLRLSIDKPWIFRLLYRQVCLLARMAPGKYLRNAMATFEQADREAFSLPQVHRAIFAATGSPRGQQWDTRLILSHWDFPLENIRIPVHLWYGDQDHNASPAMGHYLEKTIPHSHAAFLRGEGHVSLIIKYAGSILRTLTGES